MPAVSSPAAYALPLSETALRAFLDTGAIPVTALESAGLFAAALCQQRPHHPAALTRLLDDACALFVAQPEAAAGQFQTLRSALPPAADAWLHGLAAQGVVLGPDAVVARYAQASPDAYPVDAFQTDSQVTLEPHTLRFATEAAYAEEGHVADDSLRAPAFVERTHSYTQEQARALRAIIANDDEHIDLDAYAGAGKTHLILQLLDSGARRYTYIAPRAGQVQAFRQRLSAALPVQVISQIAFANHVAGDAFRRGLLRTAWRPVFQISKHALRDIAARIELQSIGSFAPASVLRIALEGIATWCRSTTLQLAPRHFARAVPWTMIDSAALMAAAEHVWRSMFDPQLQRHALLSVNVDHIGKWLALHQVSVPASWGTLLIDEGHDLSPAWKALLSSYEGAVISLGDPNQRLVGHAPRFATGMTLEIDQSVRQGRLVEQLVNDTLALDPGNLYEAPFVGSADQPTLSSTYTAWSDVPVSGARIYGSPWRLLEEAQRLAAAGAAFSIHPDSLATLGREVTRGAEAYRELTAHGGSSQRWEDLLAECEEQDLAQIPRMFMRGYNRERFVELMERLLPFHDAALQLMLVEHAKNAEFASVAMSRCCFRTGFTRQYAHNPVRAAYTAMTRGTRQLWLPGDALEELQLSMQRYQERRTEQRRSKAAPPGRPYRGG
ncbi:hypothetical protein BIY45_03570 [Stenotrophomonas sp. BIIR7]|nr:hypothetical protein BIY45_03570 [Stenotrophomonas sp. BIIR7]